MTKPWTLRQLQARMRRAGWERVDGPGSGYRHKVSGRTIELHNFDSKAGRVVWRVWARKRQVPPAEAT